MIILLPLLAQASSALPEPPPPAPGDIVVVARRGKCEVRVDDKPLSDADIARRAPDWGKGPAVRVYAPADASLKCLKKITFRLSSQGVGFIEFVDPAGRRAKPVEATGGRD